MTWADHPPPFAGLTVWLVVILAAVVKGGPPERIAAGLLLVNLLLATFLPDPLARNVMHWRTLAIDVAVFAGLAALCGVWARSWLLWAVGLQVVAVFAHVPRLLDAQVHNFVYAAALNVSGYAVVASLLAGVLMEAPRHARRR